MANEQSAAREELNDQAALAFGGDRRRGLGTNRRVEHEADLEWFFCAGESLFEASTFGALLERQATFGHRFDDCADCQGSGFTDVDGTCPKCRGMGGVHRRLAANGGGANAMRQATLPCRPCRASGKWSTYRRVRSRAKRCRLANPIECRLRILSACRECGGAGYRDHAPVGLHAPAGGGEPSYTPDDGALMRFAKVSRWLARVRPRSALVLEAYYGLSGYRWGGTKWGRLFAILPFTRAGRAMLSRVSNPMELSNHELLGNLCEQVDRQSDLKRRAVFRQRLADATAEASALFAVAASDWNTMTTTGDRA